MICVPGSARASETLRATENTKKPIKIAPVTPSPAIKMNRSPQDTSREMSSSRIRRPRTTPYAPIATTKMVTAVATHTIGHQMLLAVRAAGPLGLRIDGLFVAHAANAMSGSDRRSRRERRARSPFTVADLQLRARGDVRGRL